MIPMSKMSKESQSKLIYILMVAGLVWIYVTYVPFLMDYYVSRPQESFSWFFQGSVINPIYTFESILLTLFLVILFCLTGSGGISVTVMSIALFVLSHASYVKYVNRKELFRLDDLRLTEAAGMAAGYFRFEYSYYLMTFVGGLLLFVVIGIGIEIVRYKFLFPAPKSEKIGEKKRFKINFKINKQLVFVWIARVAVAAFLCFISVFYTTRFVLSQMTMENAEQVNLVNPDNDRYVLYRFVKNDSIGGISVEMVEESYEFLLAQEEARAVEDTAVRPNVIVIMNESWWNTDNVDPEKVSFSMDPMAPYKELAQSCITGHLTSNVYGGGTISSEAEFLTGLNTKYYVTTSTIYEKTKDRKLPSVVDYFNALDYETIAIHPYYGDFYNRNQVYQTMGFDEAIFDEDMAYQDIYTRYISDESLVKEIIKEYEEAGSNGEDNKFIWSVSISNHRRTLGYHNESIEDYDYPISVDLKGSELTEADDAILVNYINGIYYAGQAYQQLVEYFSQVKEPVIVVMFGDHIPNFSVDTLNALGISEGESAWGPSAFVDSQEMQIVVNKPNSGIIPVEEEGGESFESLEKMYSVPVVMWSNFELASQPEFDGESIFYLPQMLLESAGLPDSEMTLMLEHQQTMFKADSREFVLDASGEQLLQCTEEQFETLSHSKNITYDILFGENMRENIWQPILIE